MTRTSRAIAKPSVVTFVCIILAGCDGETPSCDGERVTDGVRSALIERAGLVRERPDFTCFGGCSPYLDGDKVQFITLETDPGGHRVRSLPTFAVNSKDFFRAIDIKISDIRVLERNADARSIRCAARVNVKIDWSAFDQGLLSKEVIKFGNFDGNVTGWNTQYEVRSKVRQELENTYSGLLSVQSFDYVAQYGTDGTLFIELD
jgi:hypothetical protein